MCSVSGTIAIARHVPLADLLPGMQEDESTSGNCICTGQEIVPESGKSENSNFELYMLQPACHSSHSMPNQSGQLADSCCNISCVRNGSGCPHVMHAVAVTVRYLFNHARCMLAVLHPLELPAVHLEAAHTCVILLQLAVAAPWTLQIIHASAASLRLWWRVLRDQPFKFGIFSFNIFAPGRSVPQRSRLVSTTDAHPSLQLPPHARAAFCILHQFLGECCIMLALFLHACRVLPWLLVPLACISCAALVSKSLPVRSTVLTVLGPGIIVVAMAVAGLAAWYRAASLVKDALMFIQGEPIYLEAWLWPIREDLNPHCGYKWLEPRKMLFEVMSQQGRQPRAQTAVPNYCTFRQQGLLPVMLMQPTCNTVGHHSMA